MDNTRPHPKTTRDVAITRHRVPQNLTFLISRKATSKAAFRRLTSYKPRYSLPDTRDHEDLEFQSSQNIRVNLFARSFSLSKGMGKPGSWGAHTTLFSARLPFLVPGLEVPFPHLELRRSTYPTFNRLTKGEYLLGWVALYLPPFGPTR